MCLPKTSPRYQQLQNLKSCILSRRRKSCISFSLLSWWNINQVYMYNMIHWRENSHNISIFASAWIFALFCTFVLIMLLSAPAPILMPSKTSLSLYAPSLLWPEAEPLSDSPLFLQSTFFSSSCCYCTSFFSFPLHHQEIWYSRRLLFYSFLTSMAWLSRVFQ